MEITLTFLTGLGDTLSVIRVDDEDDTLGILEVYSRSEHALRLRGVVGATKVPTVSP